MAGAKGYIIESGPTGNLEYETFTCFHCNRIVQVIYRAKPENVGGLCKICMRLICPQCVAVGNCMPWEKQMDQQEARSRALRSYGL